MESPPSLLPPPNPNDSPIMMEVNNASASTLPINDPEENKSTPPWTTSDDSEGTNKEESKKRKFKNRRKSDPTAVNKVVIPKIDHLTPEEEEEEEEEDVIQDFESFEEEEEEEDKGQDPDYKYTKSKVMMKSRFNKSRSQQKSKMLHLSWKEHQSHLLQAFDKLLEKETFCDVTLICDDDEGDDKPPVRIRAHKIVLSACSDYFRRILCENPCKHPIIVLKDYKAWELHMLLDFMYRGEVDVGMSKVKGLLSTAESLQIRGLPESISKAGCDLGGADVEEEGRKSNKRKQSSKENGEQQGYDLTGLNLSLEEKGERRKNEDDEEEEEEGMEEILRRQHYQIQQGLGLIMPRRKQARPRRRSGDVVAQDLRKFSPSLLNNNGDYEGHEEEYFEDEEIPPLPLLHHHPIEDELPLPLPPLMNKLLSRHLAPHPQEEGHHVLMEQEQEMNEDEMRRKRRKEEKRGGCEEVLDYTTSGGATVKKEKESRRGSLKATSQLIQNDNLQQQHLAFLRNYNWALAQQQQQQQQQHNNHRPNKMGKYGEGEFEEGEHTLPHSSSSPKRGGGGGSSPGLKQNYHHQHHLQRHSHQSQELPSFPFLQGLEAHHNQTQISNNKMSPQSPAGAGGLNFFLGTSSSMSITPLEDSSSSQSPHNIYSPMGGGLMDERGGGKNKGEQGTRGSPIQPGQWPAGLPLGPPPIFGRHRAQHSAPRGGPPRAWSNADLTEALHNVWNKKMTTSQASRIFGIPYNSLLMYVRGKYGKSLKLDLLKKGLDQALEKTAANRARTPSSPPQPAPTPPTSSAPTTPTNHNNNSSNNNRRSPTSNAVSALLNSLSHHHNNNNKEHNNNNKSNNNKMGNGGLLDGGGIHPPQDHSSLPPPSFNPFLFGDFGQASFPFASALQHIGLPPHLAMAAAAHHPGLIGQGPPSGGGNPSGMFGSGGGTIKMEKVGGEDEK